MEFMMNSIKTILVHADAHDRLEARLRMACTLAQETGARLTALYAVTPLAYIAPMSFAEGAGLWLPQLEAADRERRQAAQALFERVVPAEMRGADAQAVWADAGRDPPYAALSKQALLHDVVILGQHDPHTGNDSGLDADIVPNTLIQSGTPGIVIPFGGSFDADHLVRSGGKVVLGWKPSREAAAALKASLPWLQRARMLHLATEGDPALQGPPVHAWLRAQGVQAEIHSHKLDDRPAGEGLLTLAHDVAASLLVMGCFGHSRARELVLGGASRTVLKDMQVSVLMVH
jgi:nucleotide-binding universal stress UspA family protein